MSYEKNLYYAKKGEPLAIGSIAIFCASSMAAEEGYPTDKAFQMKWAEELKRIAAGGNIIAQYEVTRPNPNFDDSLNIIRTTETKEEIIALQNKYKENIQRLANEKNRDALYCVANDLTGDIPKKIKLFEEAADLGSALACEELYYYHSEYYSAVGSKPADHAQQFFYAKRGAESNDYYAYRCQDHLADCYAYGVGVAKNTDLYVHWKKIAAQNGSYEAQCALSRLTNNSGTNKPNNSNSSGGCYVATAVYGSYDCPEVWTLRRYRDYELDTTWYGRAFIKTYYAISPTIVKWFGETEWFKKLWKGKLDKMVAKLQEQGYENTKYNDKY